ncbi:unnamed protein product [Urochloa humidicola]
MLLLPSAPHPAQRFSAPPVAGLRSLLVLAPDAATTPGGVVTRAAAVASRRAATPCRRRSGCEASGGETSTGHCEGTKNTTEEKEEDVKGMAITEKESGIGTEEEEEEELDGFWVSYGRRRPRRRLPPPIPSLVARGALRRTRTADGRLVIRIVPVVRPECIRARRHGDGDRLTMQLVEHQHGSPMMAPPPREPIVARQEDGNIIRNSETPAEAVAAPEPETATTVPAVPPPRVSSAGCFEDVFRFDPIGGRSSLRQMPSLIRMVH